MKCIKCGAELTEGARFCHNCAAPVASFSSDGKRVRVDDMPRNYHRQSAAPRRVRSAEDRTSDEPRRKHMATYEPAAPTAQSARPRYPQNVSAASQTPQNGRPRYTDDRAPRPRYPQNVSAASQAPQAGRSRYPQNVSAPAQASQPGRPRYPQSVAVPSPTPQNARSRYTDDRSRPAVPRKSPVKKKSKKALWISLIALLLVAAILAGVIFIITQAKAADLKEAKENYEPPAKVLSADDVSFTFDRQDRILSCTYTLKGREYKQNYSYSDEDVKIVTKYKDEIIAEIEYPIKRVPIGGIEPTDEGYWLGTEPGPGNSGGNNGGGDVPDPGQTITPVENTRLSAASIHTVGLRADGTVISTSITGGYIDHGQCSVGDWTDIVAIAAGFDHTLGLKSDGTVVSTTLVLSSRESFLDHGQCDVGGWTDIVAIAAGEQHSVGLKSDGTVVAAGRNDEGQCSVEGWTDIIAIAAGGNHTVGLKKDGTVVAAGPASSGSNDVGGWRDIVAVSAGTSNIVGLRSNGTVVAAGENDAKQCEVSGWRDIVAVSAGNLHTVGLKQDGTVVATKGDANYYTDHGQSDVGDWTDIVAVSAGSSYTVGLKEDGTVVVVGSGSSGCCSVDGWNLN